MRKYKYAAVLASFLMVTMAFAIVASAQDDTATAPKLNAIEAFEMDRAVDENEANGVFPYDSVAGDDDVFRITDGPYPTFKDDGSPPGTEHMPWGSHYLSDINYVPPNNPGGWYGIEQLGAAGEYSGGNSHESYFIGDQNGNGVLEWIAGYSYKTWGNDGIDNDGDGCIDEKTFGAWDGQTGCDLVPDSIVYF